MDCDFFEKGKLELQYLIISLAVLKSTLRVKLGFTWIVDRSVKARLHYLLRTISSEESLKVNGRNSPFSKHNHSRWRMKEVAHGQFLFALGIVGSEQCKQKCHCMILLSGLWVLLLFAFLLVWNGRTTTHHWSFFLKRVSLESLTK